MPDPRASREPTVAGFSSSQIRAWAIALSMVYGTVGFALVGLLIDWAAGTMPWVTLGLAVLGLVVGTYRFIREAQALNRTSSTPRRRPGSTPTATPTGPRESGPPDRKNGP